VTFWLADRVDERGWGLAGDTFNVMHGLRDLGVDVWFSLGDRDLAIGLQRADALGEDRRLTEAQAAIATALGVTATVLPMSDQPVRTRVMAGGSWLPFQEFMIKLGGREAVQGVDFRGLRAASPTPEVFAAIATAQAIVIGPSNPVVSIGPILELAGVRAAIRQSAATVVAVSPFVDGRVLKGPTEAFMRWAKQPCDSDGIAAIYTGMVDGLVADQRTEALPVLETDVLMDTAQARRRLAQETLGFARALA
jgi:LPPG:FO 2-phospho-L-lactate transferase